MSSVAPDNAAVQRLAVPIDLARDHYLGPRDAPIILLEYGDYECPDCGHAFPLLNDLRTRFGDQLMFVFRHFPLITIHSHASIAAQAAEAAGKQGKFWPMHDRLFGHQDKLEVPDFTHDALSLGLEVYRFESELSTGVHAKRVEQDFESGQRSGVTGTPTLFINDVRYRGKVELPDLIAALERVKG